MFWPFWKYNQPYAATSDTNLINLCKVLTGGCIAGIPNPGSYLLVGRGPQTFQRFPGVPKTRSVHTVLIFVGRHARQILPTLKDIRNMATRNWNHPQRLVPPEAPLLIYKQHKHRYYVAMVLRAMLRIASLIPLLRCLEWAGRSSSSAMLWITFK
jgi:hypothetical protein